MKYVVAIVITMAALNAFIMWCMCAAGGKEDREMEETIRRLRDGKDSSGTDNKDC